MSEFPELDKLSKEIQEGKPSNVPASIGFLFAVVFALIALLVFLVVFFANVWRTTT